MIPHLKGLGQVPVIQCNKRLNVSGQQGIGQVAIEVQPSLVNLHDKWQLLMLLQLPEIQLCLFCVVSTSLL